MLAAILLASSRVSSLALILSAYPACFCYYCPRKRRPIWEVMMEWFKQRTTIAGYQISNWLIVLGAIIIVLLIFQNLH